MGIPTKTFCRIPRTKKSERKEIKKNSGRGKRNTVRILLNEKKRESNMFFTPRKEKGSFLLQEKLPMKPVITGGKKGKEKIYEVLHHGECSINFFGVRCELTRFNIHHVWNSIDRNQESGLFLNSFGVIPTIFWKAS